MSMKTPYSRTKELEQVAVKHKNSSTQNYQNERKKTYHVLGYVLDAVPVVAVVAVSAVARLKTKRNFWFDFLTKHQWLRQLQ